LWTSHLLPGAAAAEAVEASAAEAAEVSAAEAAEVSAAAVVVAAVEVSAGDHQAAVHREEAVMGVSGIQAAGLLLPEALTGEAARAAMIAEAGRERGTGAALRK
jgi:hypothetical protein